MLDGLSTTSELDWSAAILDAASVRAKGRSLIRPIPVGRGMPDSKIHVVSESTGIPLAIRASAAKAHDSTLQQMVDAIPAVRSRPQPAPPHPHQAARRQS